MTKDRSGMKRTIRNLDIDGLPADEAIEEIKRQSTGLVDPTIDVEYDGSVVTINGWVPKTDEDLLNELAAEEQRQRQLKLSLVRMIKDNPGTAREILNELGTDVAT